MRGREVQDGVNENKDGLLPGPTDRIARVRGAGAHPSHIVVVVVVADDRVRLRLGLGSGSSRWARRGRAGICLSRSGPWVALTLPSQSY